MEVQEHFGFLLPKGYKWVLQQGWGGFKEFTGLQPWFFLPENDLFFVNRRWPNGPFPGELLAFARRQDNDEIAAADVSGRHKVIVINSWTTDGYDVVQPYDSFWEWMKSVMDDIAEWSEAS